MYLSRANLGHVQNDDSRDKTDTETSDKTSSDEKSESVRGNLEDDPNGVNDATGDDSRATTEVIGKITGNEGT